MVRVLIAGVTGWTGVPLAAAVEAAADLELAGGIARRDADFASVEEALSATEADVLVDYTSAAAVRAHVDAALAAGLHVVVGSSGLTGGDYAEIDAAARARLERFRGEDGYVIPGVALVTAARR
jgi:4-hydroxy-tetrahydrodipicolinate reductase